MIVIVCSLLKSLITKAEDMANLSFLNDASVLWNLRDRYASMLIYVSASSLIH